MNTAREHTFAFLVTSHVRTERFIPLIADLLNIFWPEHPHCFFLTDGASQNADDVLSFPGRSWVELFQVGLEELVRRRPHTTHVFHMLEDHCPLRACDSERLERVFKIAVADEMTAVSFPTYAWPWNETDSTFFPDGLVRTWRHQDIVTRNGESFAVVPRDFFRYFQVQPTLWRLDYLRAACAHAAAAGIKDPWSFEAMCWSDALQHYVSRYDWPTVHHGFLEQGRLNRAAVAYLDRKRAAAPHRVLVREAIGIESPLLFDSLQILIRAHGLIRRSFASVKRRIAPTM
ncbi:MAG TPA: hypothetical protein VH206_19560 [Xanthobacteraceae bacterium]|jgi:hypothetical protein|nr:hypothetical protein [Xanthobacteraceae bacterium]